MHSKASFAITIVVVLLISTLGSLLQPDGEGVLVEKFTSGEAVKSKVFGSAGTEEGAFKFDIERDANVTIASFTVAGMDDGSGHYPRNITINLEGQGDPEYRFKGDG